MTFACTVSDSAAVLQSVAQPEVRHFHHGLHHAEHADDGHRVRGNDAGIREGPGDSEHHIPDRVYARVRHQTAWTETLLLQGAVERLRLCRRPYLAAQSVQSIFPF